VACFRGTGNVRIFAQGWNKAANEFRPQAIAGNREQVLALLRTKIPSLTHALIAVLHPGDARFSPEERERCWEAFGVPLFEQVVGRSGRLLASECEAHDGLHIENSGLMLEGCEVDETACGCGRKTPRLKAVVAPELRKTAAYAR
jgi:hypothetical protein